MINQNVSTLGLNPLKIKNSRFVSLETRKKKKTFIFIGANLLGILPNWAHKNSALQMNKQREQKQRWKENSSVPPSQTLLRSKMVQIYFLAVCSSGQGAKSHQLHSKKNHGKLT